MGEFEKHVCQVENSNELFNENFQLNKHLSLIWPDLMSPGPPQGPYMGGDIYGGSRMFARFYAVLHQKGSSALYIRIGLRIQGSGKKMVTYLFHISNRNVWFLYFPEKNLGNVGDKPFDPLQRAL